MKTYKKLFSIKIAAIPVLLTLILTLILTACSKNSPDVAQQQRNAGESKEEKIPPLLKSIEDDIEKIVKELKGPAVILEEEKKDDWGQEEEKQQQGQQQSERQDEQQGEMQKEGQGQKQQSGQGNEQNSQQKQDAQQPKPKVQDPWEKTMSLVNGLHYKWNGYMPEAAKKGASKTLLDNFGNSLNSLTNIAAEKKQMQTLFALNELYSFIPDFYSLYKTGISPEIKRIRHYTRYIILYSMTGDWARVDSGINSLKSSWTLFKNTLSKEYETTSNKMDYSIYELEKVIKDRNSKLTNIKGKVTLANIEILEKDQQKKSKMGDMQQ